VKYNNDKLPSNIFGELYFGEW